ncbi:MULTISPECIES: hypothetical protein [Stenotrophomonas]|nr:MULTISPECIES: hypothetical protein [Stenotrophomonas]ELF4099121.1 hypothetical protein [Stenotrophomonas maltophilia]MBA0428405.1 hypothetical protein [Stenotrophomonas maltophilia]MDH0276018.1 hypothetical protein [Stenotrophomonas sp. GD04089]MDH1911024.1 hypothetical protein [Stenotrophomonas sp. GD03794]WQI19776.1 hypothetical protein U2S91_16735 [Stenotrophomonas maltophilia]
MTMEVQPSQDGSTRISFGPFAKVIFTAFTSLVAAGGVWLVSSMQAVLTQQQVTNQQMATMQQQLQAFNTQLADVPAVKLELAKQAVQVEQNKQDIRELKQLRGLK